MDPFTHLLFGYLITFGIWGPGQMQYVVAGALAGGLPDADVLLFPLARRFPTLRHRGLSHSIVGVTVIAAVGTLVLPPVFGRLLGASFGVGSPVLFFLAMEAGGLSHVLLDSLDHWSIPPFAPFSDREYHLDAERIMNVGAMVFTVASYAAMIYERGRTPLWVWEWTSWVLLGLASVYIAIRVIARWRAGLARRREGFSSVIPQANPLVFLMVSEVQAGPELSIRVGRYDLLRGFRGAPSSIKVVPRSTGTGPVLDGAGAMDRSYEAALKESWILGETHHFGEVTLVPGGFEVYWYSLEFVAFGRASGVAARVDGATGAVQVKSSWRRPRGGPVR